MNKKFASSTFLYTDFELSVLLLREPKVKGGFCSKKDDFR